MHNAVYSEIWAKKHQSQKLGLAIRFGKKQTASDSFAAFIIQALNSWKYFACRRKNKSMFESTAPVITKKDKELTSLILNELI